MCAPGQRWKALPEAEKAKYKTGLTLLAASGQWGGMRTWVPTSAPSLLPAPATTAVAMSTAVLVLPAGVWVPSPLPPARASGASTTRAPAPRPLTALAAPAPAPPPPLPTDLAQILFDELACLTAEPTASSSSWLDQQQLAELELEEMLCFRCQEMLLLCSCSASALDPKS
jgi:hypothetical protein